MIRNWTQIAVTTIAWLTNNDDDNDDDNNDNNDDDDDNLKFWHIGQGTENCIAKRTKLQNSKIKYSKLLIPQMHKT